jgi:hypothetical protein
VKTTVEIVLTLLNGSPVACIADGIIATFVGAESVVWINLGLNLLAIKKVSVSTLPLLALIEGEVVAR